jgi:hypothetical protein
MGGIVKSVFGGGSQPQQVGPSAAEIEAASRPYGLTSPIGGVTWDYDARTGAVSVSPEMAAIADRLFGRAEQIGGAVTAYDPYTAAQQYYEQYVAPDLTRGQEQERLALENRLLAQGMLGSTGGALRSEALGMAQEASRRQARGEAFSQSQAMLDSMRQRELADIAAAASIYEAPVGLLQTGAGVGQGLGQIMASYRPQYAPSSGGGGGLFGGLLGGIAGGAGTVLGQMGGGFLGSKIF